MKVTQEAKGLLMDALKANDASCILVREFKSCCGTQLNFSLAKAIDGDQIESIEGVPFLMDGSIKMKTEGVTIKTENGQLFIQDENASGCAC